VTHYLIEAFWDEEARVWVASCEALPGLVTEAETVEILLSKLRVMIPELLECGGHPVAGEIPFHLHTQRHDVARAA
jgi:hypothetical protein